MHVCCHATLRYILASAVTLELSKELNIAGASCKGRGT